MYEIGDKVIYQGADKKAYKKHGVVKSIEDKDGKPQLTVELDGGETFTAPIDDWSREFSNACKNAKFKVGDKVTDGNGVYQITGIDKDFGSYDWKLISGKSTPSHSAGGNFDWAESNMKIVNSSSCTSTNSVVRNAMAVAARNAGTVYDRDLDEVTNKLEKVVKGLRQILEKMRPLMAERNRLIYKGDSNIYLSTPEGDPKTVAKYKKLIEEYGDLKMSMR